MSTQIGFPKSLSNEMDFSLPKGINTYQSKIVPSNLSSVSSTASTLTASTPNFNISGPNTNIIFDIPSSGSKSLYIDPRYTFLSFRVGYIIGGTYTNLTITNSQLRSNAGAFFDRMFMQSNGQILDDITNYGVLSDFLTQTEINVADRDSYAELYGFQFETQNDATGAKNKNQGNNIDGLHDLVLSSGTVTVYYSYCIPILNSLIGKGATKMCPVGLLNNLQVIFQTSAILPVNINTGTIASGSPTFQLTIDNIALMVNYMDIGQEAYRLLNKNTTQYLNAATYRTSTATIPNSTSGQQQFLVGLRGSSVHYLAARHCESGTLTTAGCINHIYDSKAIPSIATSWNIGGMLYPQNPIDTVKNPSLLFAETQKALGNFDSHEFKSGLVPSQFFVKAAGTYPSDADRIYTVAGSSSAYLAQSQHVFAYGLKKYSKEGILDGMDLASSTASTFYQINLTNGTTNALLAFFIAKMDIIYIIDQNGLIQVRV